MKKFLLFAGVLCIVGLVSFHEKSQEPEPFAKILKDHPERLQELLKVADSYKDTVKIQSILNSKDILSAKELKLFRKKVKSGHQTHPIVIISTTDLNALIKDHLNSTDSVVFYLGKYNKKDQKRIDRYNERNAKEYWDKGIKPYTYRDLKHRTAFALQVFSMEEKPEQKPKSTSGFFNPGNPFLSGSKGSNDVEMNDDWTNNFKPEKTAVTAVYEFSRLCPPPREGCNGTN